MSNLEINENLLHAATREKQKHLEFDGPEWHQVLQDYHAMKRALPRFIESWDKAYDYDFVYDSGMHENHALAFYTLGYDHGRSSQ